MPLLTLDRLELAYGHWPLLDGTSLVVEAGERIGLIGRNGTGKSSLLKIIAGESLADAGEVWRAPGLKLAYVPQEPQFQAGHSVFEAVAEGVGAAQTLLAEYHAVAHAMAEGDETVYADFERLSHALEVADAWRLNSRVEETLQRLGLNADAAVETLSGGLKKRVALARALVTDPELLLLDEPTNHLDIDTLELLEQLLLDYGGTVIIVSHDRAFLDNVVTQSIAFEGEGRLTEIVGGYADWRAWQQRQRATAEAPRGAAPKAAVQTAPAKPASKSKLSFKETRELEALPAQIEALEIEQAQIAERLADPVLYQSSPQDAVALQARSEAIEAELLEALTRWEMLEAKASAG